MTTGNLNSVRRSVLVLCAIAAVVSIRTTARAQWTGSTDVYKTNTSGNVGIGTTTPERKLHIADANPLEFENPSSGKKWHIYTGYNNNNDLDFVETGVAGGILHLKAGGNIGIGTTTPGRKLEVLAPDGEAFRLYRNANSVGWGVNMKFAFNNSNNSQIDVAGIHGLLQVNNAGAEQGALLFTTATSGVLSEKLRIDGNGNVGIGTASPTAKLHVSGSGNIGATVQSTTAAAELDVVSSAANSGSWAMGTGWSSGGSIRNFWVYDSVAAATRFVIDSAGSVGIGTTTPGSKLDVNGNTNVNGNITASGTINARYQDVAEWVPASEQLPAGTVVVLDANKSNQVVASTTAYDTRVAGVISSQPGITLGEKSDGKVPVATTGRVRVKVDASRGPIAIGDLLVTSDIPGTAMKSQALEFAGRKMHMPGTIIGKALEPLAKGSGEILVLLSLQ